MFWVEMLLIADIAVELRITLGTAKPNELRI